MSICAIIVVRVFDSRGNYLFRAFVSCRIIRPSGDNGQVF